MIELIESSNYQASFELTDEIIRGLRNSSPHVMLNVNGFRSAIKLTEKQIEHVSKTKILELKVDWKSDPQIQVVLN